MADPFNDAIRRQDLLHIQQLTKDLVHFEDVYKARLLNGDTEFTRLLGEVIEITKQELASVTEEYKSELKSSQALS